jgi:predicted alpha/beta superfamily hydrolase
MNQHISFTNYSDDKNFKNLFISNEIFDEQINEKNKILFRKPDDFSHIDNMILTYDGQNLFDSSTSHFGTIFDLENILRIIEDEFGKNFLIIGITSNEKRHIQYNPYPKENEINHAERHIKNIVLNFLPSVLNYLNINLDNTNQIVAGASMGGLMSMKTSILFPQFSNIISLSPAFWFGYPSVLHDIKNLSNESSTYLYTGKKEGHIFGDHVKNIFPNNWDLDFSNNDDFYYSGVKNIKDSFDSNNKKVIFSFQENGRHNETSWATAIFEILGKLI